MEEILYSIIIPHKNIPQLLQKCLNSIPQRKDIEIIIVDDNSNNNIVDFCHFPGHDMANVQLFYDKSGLGAGRARNIGLEHAKGEWIFFSDADDVFEPDFDSILNSLKSDYESDLVNFDVTSRNLEDNSPNDEIEKINYHCNKTAYINNPDSFKYIVLTPWGKAYRRSFIEQHNIRFEEIKFANDLRFATLCDFYCIHRRIIPLVGYCWMYRQNSLWRQTNIEWAQVRYMALLNTGLLMRLLGDFDIAKRYLDGSLGFTLKIAEYSDREFFRAISNYMKRFPNLRSIFFLVPVVFLKYIKLFVKKHLK